jgi:hypothetical protein
MSRFCGILNPVILGRRHEGQAGVYFVVPGVKMEIPAF